MALALWAQLLAKCFVSTAWATVGSPALPHTRHLAIMFLPVTASVNHNNIKSITIYITKQLYIA